MAWSIVKRTLRYSWKYSSTGQVRHSWTSSSASARRKCAVGNSASTLRSRIRKGKLDSSREDQQQAVATAYRREPLRGQRLEFCFAATPFREKPHGVKVSRQVDQSSVLFPRRPALMPTSFAATPFLGKGRGSNASAADTLPDSSARKPTASTGHHVTNPSPTYKTSRGIVPCSQADLRHRAGVWQARRVLHWYSSLANEQSGIMAGNATGTQSRSMQEALKAYAALN